MRGGAAMTGSVGLYLGVVSAGWPKDPNLASALFWWPFLGWLLASGVIFVLMKPSFTVPRAAATGR